MTKKQDIHRIDCALKRLLRDVPVSPTGRRFFFRRVDVYLDDRLRVMNRNP